MPLNARITPKPRTIPKQELHTLECQTISWSQALTDCENSRRQWVPVADSMW